MLVAPMVSTDIHQESYRLFHCLYRTRYHSASNMVALTIFSWRVIWLQSMNFEVSLTWIYPGSWRGALWV